MKIDMQTNQIPRDKWLGQNVVEDNDDEMILIYRRIYISFMLYFCLKLLCLQLNFKIRKKQ